MPVPVPPKPAAPAPAVVAPKPAPAVVAPKPAPVAAPAAPATEAAAGEVKHRESKFGPKEGAIPGVTLEDGTIIDPKIVFDVIAAAVKPFIPNVSAFVLAFDKMSSKEFPGSKVGRATYGACNLICRVDAVEQLYSSKPRAVRTAKPAGRNKKLQKILKRLLAVDAGAVEALKAEGIDISALGIDLAGLSAE